MAFINMLIYVIMTSNMHILRLLKKPAGKITRKMPFVCPPVSQNF